MTAGPVAMEGALGKREATKQANRGAILDAALDVFSDIGYGASTVRDVIRRTGLAAGTFYNYFPDKESVLQALLDDIGADARARVRAARTSATTTEEFVTRGFRAYFEWLAEDRVKANFMRRNAGTIRIVADEPVLGAGVEELAEDLRAGIAAGRLPAMDVEYMAAAMVGAGWEVGVRMLDHDPIDVEAAVAFVRDVFLGGIDRLR